MRASASARSSGVFSLRSKAICTSRRCAQFVCSLTRSNSDCEASFLISAATTSTSTSLELSSARAIMRGSESPSRAAATRPEARRASAIFSPAESDSSRFKICLSAARLISAATAGASAARMRSNVKRRRNIGSETWRGVRGWLINAIATLRLFATLGFRASETRVSAVTSGRCSSARAWSSLSSGIATGSGSGPGTGLCCSLPSAEMDFVATLGIPTTPILSRSQNRSKEFNRKVARAAQRSRRGAPEIFFAIFANSLQTLRLKVFASPSIECYWVRRTRVPAIMSCNACLRSVKPAMK